MSIDRPDGEQIRVDRRAAMKAALAGAAAAAVWQAPRIEGLSIAPDAAEAATCAPVTVPTVNHSADKTILNQCWGTLSGGCIGFNFGPQAFGRFTVGLNVDGTDAGTGFGGANANIAGISSPLQSCTYNLVANCFDIFTLSDVGGATGSPIRTVFNANGQNQKLGNAGVGGNQQFSCNAFGLVPGNVVVNITCACTR